MLDFAQSFVPCQGKASFGTSRSCFGKVPLDDVADYVLQLMKRFARPL